MPAAITSVFRNNSLAAKISSHFLGNETKNELFYFLCVFLPFHLLQHSAGCKDETGGLRDHADTGGLLARCLKVVLSQFSHFTPGKPMLFWAGFLDLPVPSWQRSSRRCQRWPLAARAASQSSGWDTKGVAGPASPSQQRPRLALSQGAPGRGAASTPSNSHSSIFHGERKTQEDFFSSAFHCFLFWSQRKSNTFN